MRERVRVECAWFLALAAGPAAAALAKLPRAARDLLAALSSDPSSDRCRRPSSKSRRAPITM